MNVTNSPTLKISISWVRAVIKKNKLKKNLNWLNKTFGTKVNKLYLVFLTIFVWLLGGSHSPVKYIVLGTSWMSLKKTFRTFFTQVTFSGWAYFSYFLESDFDVFDDFLALFIELVDLERIDSCDCFNGYSLSCGSSYSFRSWASSLRSPELLRVLSLLDPRSAILSSVYIVQDINNLWAKPW